MIPSCHKTHRHIAIVLLTLLCIMQISIPIYKVKAQLAVKDLLLVGTVTAQTTANAANTTAITGAITSTAAAAEKAEFAREVARIADRARLESQSFLERYVLYPAIRVLIFTLIQTLTNQTVAWIKGDEGRDVGFVKNLEQNAFDEANIQAGEFLNHLTKIDLCSVNFHQLIKAQITQPGFRHLNPQLACTLTKIVGDLDAFYQDFNQGGWPMFIGSVVDLQNNPIGASFIAQVNFQAAQNSTLDALQKRINAGSGFQGLTLKKKSEVCDFVPDDLQGTVEECRTETVNTTPGVVISDALNTSLNHVGVDMGIAESTAISNAVDAAISSIIQALMQRLFKEATTLF